MRVVLFIALVTGAASIAHANCPYLDGGTIAHNVPLGCPLELYYPADSTFTPPATITVMRNGAPVALAVTSSAPVPRLTLHVSLDRPNPATCRSEWYEEPRELDGIALEVDGLVVGDEFSTSIIGEANPCVPSTMESGFEQWLYCESPSASYTQCCEALDMPTDCYQPTGLYPGSSGCSSSSSASLGVALVLLALRKRKRRTT